MQYPGIDRNLVTLQPVRIAGAVIILMMIVNRLDDRIGKVEIGSHKLRAFLHVAADLTHLFRCKRPLQLLQITVHEFTADIMQKPCSGKII